MAVFESLARQQKKRNKTKGPLGSYLSEMKPKFADVEYQLPNFSNSDKRALADLRRVRTSR